jgi:hypothetical protein
MNMDEDLEIWKPLFDEPWYEVSNHGRVRSWIAQPPWDGGRLSEPHYLRSARARGYSAVVVGPRGTRRHWLVHLLVLYAFVGPLPEGMQTRHLDGNKRNNHLSNLKYGTPPENGADRVRLGEIPRGADHYLTKLTDARVLEIRQRYANGEGSYRQLGREYGVDNTTIMRIVRGLTWTHLPLAERAA